MIIIVVLVLSKMKNKIQKFQTLVNFVSIACFWMRWFVYLKRKIIMICHLHWNHTHTRIFSPLPWIPNIQFITSTQFSIFTQLDEV